MEAKAFEIRDRGTFIPAVAVRMAPAPVRWIGAPFGVEEWRKRRDREEYLLRRAGFELGSGFVILARMECEDTRDSATYDPHAWTANGTRTLWAAHKFIQKNWDDLRSGDVVDVEHILGETPFPKKSEQESHPL